MNDTISPPPGFTLVQPDQAPTPPPGFTLATPSTVEERVGTGMLDPAYGTGQFLAHNLPDAAAAALGAMPKQMRDKLGGTPPSAAQTADQTIQAREAEIKAGEPQGTDWARMAGNIASPMNYLPTAGAGPVMQAVELGTRAGAMQPVAEGDYNTEKAHQLEMGAATGLGTGLVAKGLGAIIAPKVAGPAKELLDAGVELTPGQIAGGMSRRAEEAAKSAPILGTGIRGAEGRAIDSFNLATANKALDPIGVTIPTGTTGRDIIDQGQSALSSAYDNLLPKMTFQTDATFASDINALRGKVSMMPPAQQDQFLSILKNRMAGRIDPTTGQMDGQTLKEVQSELSHFASMYGKAPDPAQRQLGQTVAAANDALQQALIRQNPGLGDELKAINSAYAMWVRVEGAAGRRATSNGQFTPGDLLGAIKTADRSVRRRSFATGDALLQPWAENAAKVISNRLPDSGTPERLLWDISGGAASYFANPGIPVGLAAGRAAYSRPGTAAIRAYLNPGATRSAVGGFLRGAVPYGEPAVADYVNAPPQNQPLQAGFGSLPPPRP